MIESLAVVCGGQLVARLVDAVTVVNRPALLGLLLRQRSPVRQAGAWAFALLVPPLIAAATEPVRGSLELSGYLTIALLVVVVVSLIGGVRPALFAVVVAWLAGDYVFAAPYNTFRIYLSAGNAPLVAFIVVGAAVGLLVDQLVRLLEEQTALRRIESGLRRVATLVARGAPADELFAAATEEVGRLLSVEIAILGRYESDETMTIAAVWSAVGDVLPAGGISMTLGGENMATLVSRSGRPGRIDDYAGDPSGEIGGGLRGASIRSSVGAPIVVEGRLWGVMVAGSQQPFATGIELRLASFTEILATAIANAQSRIELDASRARIVAASDETRRRIERDLHDGTQQRLVSLGLEVRSAISAVPAQLPELGADLARIAGGLASVQEELREIVRGIHPAILAMGGIGPALRTLARRSAVPVELDVRTQARLPERVEVATYYIVSEALTNAAKHAQASAVRVDVEAVDSVIRIAVADDGVGGADKGKGTGLVGLKDRIEALGGAIAIDSPAGQGTRLRVEIPVGD